MDPAGPDEHATPWTRSGDPGWTSVDGGAPPERIGRYTLLGLLGRGGMGVVHVARDDLLGRRIALKLLGNPDARPAAQARLLREAQALARLTHPNVVTVHEAGEHDGRVFLAMELVTGDTLRVWLRERRPDAAARLDIAVQAGRGLAAAHDAGLVHRDFKPDNVMVGDDGRVRVMDFGLASVDPGDPPTAGDPRGRITVAGALLGTPGYMAPELREGRAAGAYSDIYSFCVVLAELFTGVRPQPDDDAGDVRAALRAARVPAWLSALVLRGLHAAPDERWPTMHALLAAISAAVRRRRRRVLAGLAAVAVVVVAGLVLAGLELREHLRQARREAEATARLAALTRDGDPEAAFARFVAEPEHRRTRALVQAWLDRGARARADGRVEAAIVAVARAYVEATHPDDVDASLRALAGLFAASGDAAGLERATAELRARGADDEATRALAGVAALGLRDLAGAVTTLAADDPWRATLTALARGRPLGWELHKLDPLDPGGAAAYAVITRGPATLLVDRALATVRRLDDFNHAFPGTTTALRGQDIVDLAAPTVVLARTEREVLYNTALRIDATRSIGLFTHVWPHYGFHRIDAPGAAAPRVAHAMTDSAGAALASAWSGDLDGDGRDELIAAFAPPDDLRVFQTDERDELRLVARRLQGQVRALAAMRSPDPLPHGSGRLLVVADPGGYALLRWTGAALVEVGRVQLSADEIRAATASRPLVAADLDGDGADELVHGVRVGSMSGMRVVRGVGTGSPAVRVVGGVLPQAALDLDDDAAEELLVSVEPNLDAWVLGDGERAPPDLRAPVLRPPPLALADPWLAERVAHAESLAAMSRTRTAADALEDLARLSVDAAARDLLLARAAVLWIAAGEDARAVAIDRRLVDHPALGPAARVRSALALERLGRLVDAHAAALAVAAHPSGAADDDAAALRLATRLAPLVRDVLTLVPDSSPAVWRLGRPASLRHAVGDQLVVSAATGPAALAEVPLTWDGEALAVEAEIDVQRLESGGCLTLAVEEEDGRPWLSTSVCGGADERSLRQMIRCFSPTNGDVEVAIRDVPAAATPGRVVLRFAWFAGHGAAFTPELDGSSTRWTSPDAPAAGRALRLVLAARSTWPRPALAAGAVRALRVHGARLGPPAPATAWDLAARHLVDDDPRAARAVLGDMSANDVREHLIRVAALERLGDLDALTAAVDAVAPALLRPEHRADLALLVRTRPLAAAALRRRLGAATLPALVDVWSGLLAHRDDPGTRTAALAGLYALADPAPTTPEQHAALRRLWTLRGLLAEREGRRAGAVHDLEAALALATDEDDGDAMIPAAHAALARLLVDESPVRAGAHARAAVRRSATPEATHAELRADAALAGLVGDDPP